MGGEDGEGAAGCTRTGPSDWFAHGHVEAVRAALGSPPGAVEAPPVDPGTDTTAGRLRRAVAVAAGAGAPRGATAAVVDGAVVLRGAALAVGALAERVRVALWAESLAAEVRPSRGGADGGDDAALHVVVTGPGGPAPAAGAVGADGAQASAGPSPS